MSITIKNETPGTREPKLHLLPFQVSYSGTARIPNFFTLKETDDKAFDGMISWKKEKRGRERKLKTHMR